MTRVLAAAALALWLGAGGAPSRKEYLAHVSSVCTSYAHRLERVPAPSDPAAYGNVISSLRQALPLLRAQERKMRAIPAPPALQPRLRALFALDRRSISELGAALVAAEHRNAGGVASGLARFTVDRGRVHAAAVALGIRCTPN